MNILEGLDPRCTAVGFAKHQLDLQLYPWQEQVLWDIDSGDRPVALAAANGSGKTSMIAAPALLWHVANFPGGEVVTTAGVFRQVKEQLWGQIKRFHGKLGPDWEINETSLKFKNGSTAIGFTTEDPYKFEGWHGGESGHLFMIFDEAKAIDSPIFEAARRCNAKSKKRMLLMSSTGINRGVFADAFGHKGGLYSKHIVTAMQCPHLKKEEIDALIAEYGREHKLVKSAIFSEFYDVDGESAVISWADLQECLLNPPLQFGVDNYAFIDWAAGGDECAIARLHGNKIPPLFCWRTPDTGKSIGKAIKYLRENNVSPDNTFADGSGMGNIAMNNQMRDMGFPVNPVNNGAAARDSKRFANRGAEIWFKASEQIRNCKIILPNDDKLHAQLTSRVQIETPAGKSGLEKKEDMKARGVNSPDRADAVCGVIACSGFFSRTFVKSELFDEDVEVLSVHGQPLKREGYEGFFCP